MEGHGSGGPNLEPRVKQLEHSVESMHADMGRMQTAISGISGQMSSFGKTLDSVAEKLDVQRTKRPELGALAAVVAVILAIGSAVLWPINDKIDRTQDALNAHQKLAQEQAARLGEARADAKHAAEDVRRLQDRIDQLQ